MVSMALKRPRTTANLDVPQIAYNSAVLAWFEGQPMASLSQKVGPRYIVDLRATTPTMGISLLPFFHSLADQGATSGVLQALVPSQSLHTTPVASR